MKIEKGTRIYYNGDMANQPGIGTITKRTIDKWGDFVDIEMDDGRLKKSIPVAGFSKEYDGTGRTRFVTLKAYNDYRVKMLRNNDYEGHIKLAE